MLCRGELQRIKGREGKDLRRICSKMLCRAAHRGLQCNESAPFDPGIKFHLARQRFAMSVAETFGDRSRAEVIFCPNMSIHFFDCLTFPMINLSLSSHSVSAIREFDGILAVGVYTGTP